MSKMNFYACDRNNNRKQNRRRKANSPTENRNNVFNINVKDKDKYIEMKLNYLLNTKYKSDLKVREDIIGETNIYALNLKIASDLKDKKSIKQLQRNFIYYLNNL